MPFKRQGYARAGRRHLGQEAHEADALVRPLSVWNGPPPPPPLVNARPLLHRALISTLRTRFPMPIGTFTTARLAGSAASWRAGQACMVLRGLQR